MTATGSETLDEAPPDASPTGMVVGVDGSAPSMRALEWAARRTDRFGPIQPVIAWHFPWWSYVRSTVPTDDPFEAAARAEIEKTLGSVRSSDVEEPIIVRARAASALVEIGASAGLIVVGTRGRSGLADGVLGSVAAGVVARSTVPVAVVPPSAPIEDRHRRVVVGIDGSPNSVHALEWALNNVPATWLVEAVHAWVPPVALPGSALARDESGYEAQAQAVLDESLSQLSRVAPASPRLSPRLAHGDPRSVLREWSMMTDLIVLGARGRGLVADLLLGSVTTALVHRPRTTTVVIPARRQPRSHSATRSANG